MLTSPPNYYDETQFPVWSDHNVGPWENGVIPWIGQCLPERHYEVCAALTSTSVQQQGTILEGRTTRHWIFEHLDPGVCSLHKYKQYISIIYILPSVEYFHNNSPKWLWYHDRRSPSHHSRKEGDGILENSETGTQYEEQKAVEHWNDIHIMRASWG